MSNTIQVDQCVNSLLSRWALIGMLSGFERHINGIRDSVTIDLHYKKKPRQLLETLLNRVAQGIDISAASVELKHFSEEEFRFEHDVGLFKPSNIRLIGDENITLIKALRDQIGERSEWIRNRDESVNEFMTQYGTILGARENIELQRRLSIQTGIMVFLTVIITMLTAIMAWLAMKSTNII